MKEKMESLKYSFVIMFSLLLCSVAFVSCGDDDEEVVGDEIYYSAVFTTVNTQSNKADKEMAEIKKAFSNALGEDLSNKNHFVYVGSLENCDSKVRNACYEAKASLAGNTWEGFYVFTITNENTSIKIFEYSVGSSKEE